MRPHRRRQGVALLAVVVLGSLLVLSPSSPAGADFAQSGLNEAQLNVVHEGMPGFITNSFEAQITVEGKKFIALDVAQLFQCRAGETDLRGKCMALGTIATGPDGSFTTVVNTSFTFVDPSRTTVDCIGGTQCAVAAATYDKTTEQNPTSQAEHWICFNGFENQGCSWDSAASSTTTTSTTAPPTTTTLPPTTTTTTPPPPATSCTLREVANPHPPPPSPFPPFSGEEVGSPSTANPDPAWKRELSAGPSPREGMAMTYDSKRRETVLFGGFSPTDPCVLGDTWVWDGANWAQRNPAKSPPARYGHAMAFDGERIVLFGGYNGTEDLGDTWTWDGTTWEKKVGLDTAPSLRARTSMAYDATRDETVLFGGDHDKAALGDTWIWNGGAWTRRVPATSPPPRGYSTVAYHAPSHEVVLRGGWDMWPLQDTWTWDGATWTLRANRDNYQYSAAMAHHRATGLTVLQPGSRRSNQPSGSPDNQEPGAIWDGNGWANLQSGSAGASGQPPGRRSPAMAEDALGQVVFFGGYGWENRENVAQARFCPVSFAETGVLGLGGVATEDLQEDFDETGYPCTPATQVPGGSDAQRGDTWTLATPGTGTPTDKEHRVTVTLAPSEITSDGRTTTKATASVTRGGVPLAGQEVRFSTDGDVTFASANGLTDATGSYVTTITASITPAYETITAETGVPTILNLVDGVTVFRGSAVLVEKGLALTLDPPSIPADGSSESVASVTLVQSGDLAAEQVCFSTDGDVTFLALDPGHCGVRTGDRTWTIRIRASLTGGKETITASTTSGLSASAILDVGGGQWFNRTVDGAGPTPARDSAAMAYDPVNRKTVLFGGFEGNRSSCFRADCTSYPLGDTWVWDGSTWAQVSPPQGTRTPGVRWGHTMAYDASSGQIVLFGGRNVESLLGDTWTFDVATSTWTERHPDPAPPARYMANMAADGVGAVLFSGTNGFASDNFGPTARSGPGHLADTWTWRNGEWTFHQPVPPAPQVTVGRDFANNNAVVVPLPPPAPGCPAPTGCPADKANPYPSPVAVSGVTGTVADAHVTLNDLSYRSAEGGGLNDLDIMVVAPDGTAVMVMSDACGDSEVPRTGPITLKFDSDPQRPLLPGGSCASGTYRPTDATTEENTPAHRPDAFSSPAPPRAHSTSLDSFRGIDPNGTWSLYVVDDGPNDPNPVTEAGRIDGGWTLNIATTETPTQALTSPPGRGRAAIAYHPPTGKVVMYGGSEEFQFAGSITGTPFGGSLNPLADTWTWDGNTWTQHGSGANPGPRHSAAMAHHPGTGQLMLFGGGADDGGRIGTRSGASGRSTALDDTWTWSGTAWALQSQPIKPPARMSAAVAEDPSGRILLFGGMNSTEGPGRNSSSIGDTWTWEPRVSLRLSRATIAADGTSTAVATARVTDAAGQPVRGLDGAVSFVSDGDIGVSPIVEQADGAYVATLTASRTVGIETLTVHTPSGSASATLEEGGAQCSPERSQRPSGTWSPVAPMPAPRTALAAAAGNNGRIYAFGGAGSANGDRDGVSTVEEYDPCTNSWQTLPSMPGGRRFAAAAAAAPDGRIYLAGGVFTNAALAASDRLDVYTPGVGAIPGRWDTLPPMNVARYYATATVDDEGNLYVAGGIRAVGMFFDANASLDSVEMYSPRTRSWTVVNPCPPPDRA